MCLAIPGKVLSVHGRTATVDFGGSRMNALYGLVDLSPGDSVIVHAGCIIQKMRTSEEEELLDLMREMQEV